MKTLLAALIVGAFTFATGASFAQEKKVEPKEEAKKAETKKATDPAKPEAKKDDASKKKVKKGGC